MSSTGATREEDSCSHASENESWSAKSWTHANKTMGRAQDEWARKFWLEHGPRQEGELEASSSHTEDATGSSWSRVASSRHVSSGDWDKVGDIEKVVEKKEDDKATGDKPKTKRWSRGANRGDAGQNNTTERSTSNIVKVMKIQKR